MYAIKLIGYILLYLYMSFGTGLLLWFYLEHRFPQGYKEIRDSFILGVIAQFISIVSVIFSIIIFVLGMVLLVLFIIIGPIIFVIDKIVDLFQK